MEILIEGLDDEAKKQYQDKHGMYQDVCEWLCIGRNGDERVVEIGVGFRRRSGSIQLRYAPPKVKILKMSSPWMGGELAGSVELAHLPDGMQQLYLESNQLTDKIDLTHLPSEMEVLYLQNNQLTGEIDLTHLPDEMIYLHLKNNQFPGSFVIKTLTDGTSLYAQGNQFNAIAVVDSNLRAIIKLEGSGVTSVLDENGRERDMELFLR